MEYTEVKSVEFPLVDEPSAMKLKSNDTGSRKKDGVLFLMPIGL